MRMLIVEDDPDGREMLAELFRLRDWRVTAVPSTWAAIDELRGGGFDVVISDENLEGQSGSTMLRQAAAEGLLKNVGALMYTAEPGELEVPDGVRVFRKPLGIAKLVDEATAAVPDTKPPSSGERRTRRVDLVLYITRSPSSQRALRNIESVLAKTHPARVTVVVRDLDEEDSVESTARTERRIDTPVLVRYEASGENHPFSVDLESAQRVTALIEELDGQPMSSNGPPSS